MNTTALAALGQNARLWAKTYVALVEALLAEGLEEDEARAEARFAATMAALPDDGEPDRDGPRCPLCGG